MVRRDDGERQRTPHTRMCMMDTRCKWAKGTIDLYEREQIPDAASSDEYLKKDISRLQVGTRALSGSEDAILLDPSDAGEDGSSRSQSPDPKGARASPSAKLKHLTSGWRSATVYWFAAVTFTFLINLFTAIGLVATYGVDGDGIGVMMDGECSSVKAASLWTHVVINILSTGLLSASNYCMQIVTSPTREEVDRAHREGKWLDIGVQSIRNLFKIKSKRMWLWVVLVLSSLPLHLMYVASEGLYSLRFFMCFTNTNIRYNSTIFQSLNSQSYQVFVVTEDFLTGDGSWDLSSSTNALEPGVSEKETGANLLKLHQSISTLDRLSPEDCIQSYATDIVSQRKNLLAVTKEASPTNDSLITWFESGSDRLETYNWMCSDVPTMTCDVPELLTNVTQGPWIHRSLYGRIPIDYCLSEQVEESCRLQFSLHLMVIVIICNLAKALTMLSILLRRASTPLINTGDAVSSFLDTTDHTTAGLCLSSKKDFPKGTAWTKSSLLTSQKGRQTWKPARCWWFSIPGVKRWILTLLPAVIAIGVSGRLLNLGLNNLGVAGKATDIASLATMGVGAVNPLSVLRDDMEKERFLPSTLTGFILLANLPQLIVSVIYFAFNSLFTCMLLAHEWNSYTYKRKPLRVTSPNGQQRSTYYLSLPYSYAIPLMGMSGLLHWLVSQSFFLVRMDEYASTGEFIRSTSNCGYSCIAIILAIMVGCLLVLSALAMGCRRYKTGIPAAGSCSAAISAACHPPPGDQKAATLPVQWGAVEGFENSNGVGHCSFTTREVSLPIPGNVYAGFE
ncbi:hypothetical protein FQN54_002743 [Arachnomyces sp. PD_36]|nr:hypothetical protein FQN54_002743 [Arachnomyces sp. PD_36]